MTSKDYTQSKLENDVEPVKGLLEEIVDPQKRSNINIIPEHVTGLRGTKIKRQRKNGHKKKKLFTLNRKEYAKLGLYNLPTKALKYGEILPLHELWKGYMKQHLSMDGNYIKIPEIYDPSYDAFNKLLMKSDLHGAKLTVLKSKCPSLVGHFGIVVLETKNCFKLLGTDDKLRTIIKEDCIFTVKLDDVVITIFGKHLTIRPSEKSVKKMKNLIEPDL